MRFLVGLRNVRAGTVLVAIGLLLLLGGFARIDVLAPHTIVEKEAGDFDVVYCGVRVAFAKADPYRVEPSRTCQAAVEPTKRPRWALSPMPLPGYALVLLAPFALLPYVAAKTVWLVAMLAAFYLSAYAMSRVLARPFPFVALLGAPALLVLVIPPAEPIAIVIAALCASAWALVADRPKLAAACACVTMIEPHVGLPACLGLAIFEPRARLWLAIGTAALAATSLALLGPQVNLEYFTTFLPAHATSELFAFDQYSLAHVLALMGAPAPVALRIATIQYALAVVLGIVGAARVLAAGGSRAAALLVPVVPAMLGGIFVHDLEMASALPGALLLASDALASPAAIAGALLLVFSPGAAVITNKVFEAAGLAALAVAIVRFVRAPRVVRATLAVAAVCVWAIALQVYERQSIPRSHFVPHPERVVASAPSPELWQMRVDEADGWSVETPATILFKIPWWLGLGLVTFAALRARPRISENEAETHAETRGDERVRGSKGEIVGRLVHR